MIEEIDILKKAVSIFGKEPQIWMAVEEMAELNNALAKLQRNRVTNEEVCEEIADVFIMMIELSYIFGNEHVNKQIENKIQRLKQRIQKHETIKTSL